MEIAITKAAEVALRSLQDTEQRRMMRVLGKLNASSHEEFIRDPNTRKFVSRSAEKLYIYRGNEKLRLILSVKNDAIVVEDVLSQERLARMLPKWGTKV